MHVKGKGNSFFYLLRIDKTFVKLRWLNVDREVLYMKTSLCCFGYNNLFLEDEFKYSKLGQEGYYALPAEISLNTDESLSYNAGSLDFKILEIEV